MGYIFISYSHKDKDYVHSLAETLRQNGFEIWIDNRIDYGIQWAPEIQQQLDNCDAFILVASENSFQSEWVQHEVTRAQRKKKPFFPLLLSGDTWLSIESVQYVDVKDGNLPPQKFYENLANHVDNSPLNFSEDDYPFWITEEWPEYKNLKYGFRVKHPPHGEITENSEDRFHIDLPVPTGTDLRDKRLTIECSDRNDCNNILENELSPSGFPYPTQRVKINDKIFMRQTRLSSAMGKGIEEIVYSIARNHLCIAITFLIVVVDYTNYYPNLINRIDINAEKEVVHLVLKTFEWFG